MKNFAFKTVALILAFTFTITTIAWSSPDLYLRQLPALERGVLGPAQPSRIGTFVKVALLTTAAVLFMPAATNFNPVHAEEAGVKEAPAVGQEQLQDREEEISGLVRDLSNRRPSIRLSSAYALGKIKDIKEPKIRDVLIKALEDEETDVRSAAASSLDILGLEPQTEQERIAYLFGKKKWEELAEIGQPAADILIKKGLTDRNSDIRKNAIEALEKFNWTPQTIEDKVVYFLAKGEIEELVKLGQESVASLKKYLGNYEFGVELKILKALSEAGYHLLDGELLLYKKMDELRGDSRCYTTHVCHYANEELGHIKHRQAMNILIANLRTEYWMAPGTAARALVNFADNPVVLDELLNALQKKISGYYYGDSLHSGVAWTLGMARDRQAVEALVEKLLKRDEHGKPPARFGAAYPDVAGCISAAKALVKIGDKGCIPALVKTLEDIDVNIRQASAKSLAAFDWEPRTDRELAVYLIAKQAWEELTKVSPEAMPSVIEALVHILGDNDIYVKKSAARTLDNLNWKPKADGERIAYLIAKASWDEIVKMGPIAAETLLNASRDTDIWGYQGAPQLYRRKILDTLSKINPPPLDLLIMTLRKGGYENAISSAEYVLKNVGQPAADSMIRLLADENRYVRMSAIRVLSGIKDPEFVDALIQILLVDPDPYVRLYAASTLGKIKNPKALDALIKALEDKEHNVRYSAANALGEIKDLRAVDALTKTLEDNDDGVRKAAAKALGEIKDPRVVDRLIKALGDKDRYVRREVVKALGEVGDKKATEFLIKVLDDEDTWTRKDAAGALGKLKDPVAIEPLRKVLEEKESGLRLYAAKSLYELNDPQGREILLKALEEDVDVGWLREILDEIKDKKLVEVLSKAIDHKSGSVRKAAAKALGEIKDPRALDSLIKTLEDKDSYVREAAAEALEALDWKPKTQEENISYLIAKRDWDELVKIGQPAVGPLIKALGDKEWSGAKRAVAKALGELKDPRAIDVLIKALGYEDADVRYVAAEALDVFDWKPKTQEENISYLIAKKNWDELVKIGQPAVDALIEALSDNDWSVRKAAIEALGEIKDPKAIDALTPIRNDRYWSHWKARNAAQEAIEKIQKAIEEEKKKPKQETPQLPKLETQQKMNMIFAKGV